MNSPFPKPKTNSQSGKDNREILLLTAEINLGPKEKEQILSRTAESNLGPKEREPIFSRIVFTLFF